MKRIYEELNISNHTSYFPVCIIRFVMICLFHMKNKSIFINVSKIKGIEKHENHLYSTFSEPLDIAT